MGGAGAALWNLALGPGRELQPWIPISVRTPPMFDRVALFGGALFLLLAVREMALVTRVSFGAGRLVVRALLAPWVRLDIPFADIQSFEVIDQGDGTYRVAARMQAGGDRKLPLHFETVPLRSNWNRRMLLASPVAYASFLATRLTEMLDAARRSGHDTYRE